MEFDVILVFACGITNQGTLPESACKRIRIAQQLFKQKRAARILMSGKWSSYWEHFPPAATEARLMEKYAISLGIPQECILLEEHSHNTSENIFYSKKLFFEPYNWKRILMITSRFHIPRVKRIIRAKLDPSYLCEIIGVENDTGLVKNLWLHAREKLLLYADWFFDNFLQRK